MTRSQVRFTLGTPLVMDIFHGDRWGLYLSHCTGVVESR
ncbi:MAG: outer membrane protein assembly factor BamE [Nitrosomonas sp.]|nr:outer membrane protein assembly factor BamE [Nitrosomonas sp.]